MDSLRTLISNFKTEKPAAPPPTVDGIEPVTTRDQVKWYRSLPLFVPGDVDAFAGLFSNNLATMLSGAQMLSSVLPAEIIYGRIVPGVGLSMLFGTFYYSLHGLITAAKTGQTKLCCLPFGINTPGVFAFNSGVIMAVYYAEGGGAQAAETAWQVGVAANFVQGVVNVSLSPFGPHISKAVPMVALLGSISSVGIAWLYANTMMSEFAWPLVTMAPFFLILAALLAGVKIPHVPTTVLPVVVGAILAWISGKATVDGVRDAADQVGWKPALLRLEPFQDPERVMPYVGIAIPLALTVAIGSIQIRAMASNAGDEFNLCWTMAGDGIATIIASFFGSPWGMTVFIGHGAFKAMGAQVGYSFMTGIAFIIVCFSGLSSLVLSIFPAEVLNPIILYVGLVVCVEALEITPPRHWPAFLVALVPGFFNWAQQVASDFAAAVCEQGFLVDGSLVEAGSNAACAVSARSNEAWTLRPTLVAVRTFGKGYILTSIVWAAMVVYIADSKFGMAAIWSLIGAALSAFGLVHAEVVFLPWEPEGDASFHWELVGGYVLTAGFLVVIELVQRFKKQPSQEPKDIEEVSPGEASIERCIAN
mmetsp:Transcript_81406/g.170220  ORF Transcript_81406/g.170220 Transcript_81406/m.170220 type:complete len:589 (-) Transcript_81406:128-1894(-)